LDDPQIEAQWFGGRYEIIEGVLTMMAPAYFAGGSALANLLFAIQRHLEQKGTPGRIAPDVDIIMAEARVVVADAVMMTPEDMYRQAEAVAKFMRSDPQCTRILVPPTLVIESVSPGHETHDTRTKRGWYAEFGVPNYWILDAFHRTLECLVLSAGGYQLDQFGTNVDVLRPKCFPGLGIDLKRLWGDIGS
jgi:Uma2 family endonuclease